MTAVTTLLMTTLATTALVMTTPVTTALLMTTVTTTLATYAAGALAGVCPSPLVIQTDWFAEAEHGALYELIGDDYTVDGDNLSVLISRFVRVAPRLVSLRLAYRCTPMTQSISATPPLTRR